MHYYKCPNNIFIIPSKYSDKAREQNLNKYGMADPQWSGWQLETKLPSDPL